MISVGISKGFSKRKKMFLSTRGICYIVDTRCRCGVVVREKKKCMVGCAVACDIKKRIN